MLARVSERGARRRATAGLIACAIASAYAGHAHAQSAPSGAPAITVAPTAEQIEARAAFERGVELARLERWAEALEEFRRSRALNPRPSAAVNMASCLVRLGRAIEAVAAFDDYFRLVTDPAQEGARYTDARQQLAVTRATIATATISVTPADATVAIDGIEQPGTGAARRISLDPRAHRIVVSAPRHTSYTVDVSPRQGEQVTLAASLRRNTGATLTVTATPASATVAIDGRVAALSTPVALNEGRHSVVVRANDHETSERWVELTADDQRAVHVDLRPAQPRSVARSPWLWTGVGVGVAAITATVLAIVLTQPSTYGGSTNTVILGLHDGRGW